MGLINLQTNLKSLKFGHDRIDAGNSGQPYIQSPIPDKVGEFGFLNTDFVLRGGSKAVTNSLKDVERLGKYFTDIRNPSGLLFVAKQNLLSRTAVRTQASGFLLNEGAYTPLSTLIEAGGVAFGLHVNKQGLNPFGGFGGINTYSSLVNPNLGFAISIKNVNKNRLVNLWNDKIAISTSNTNVLSYGGGPGSFLGIGKTNIKFADQRTGLNNINGKKIIGGTYLTDRASQTINRISLTSPPLGVANKWFDATKLIDIVSTPNLSTDNGYTYIYTNNVGDPAGEFYGDIKLGNWLITPVINGYFVNSNSTITYTQKELLDIPTNVVSNGESVLIKNTYTTKVGDFRALLRKNLGDYNYTITEAPNYTEYNIEQRVSLGNPGDGSGKNILSYTSGSGGKYFGAASEKSYDKITTKEIYTSQNPSFSKETDTNDLVKFAITVIDNDNQSKNTNIHFRAFLNSISDQYSADWNPTRYIGRGENFYTYGGFDRKVSLSWTVAAQSKIELIPMYKKLNYLASVCAPDYSENGYMRGNLIKLTIGGYFYEQPGIITGFSYEMNDDNSTWEIGIDDKAGYDSTVKELPHLIKVTGFNFIPIHNFVPRKVQKGTEDINTQERFIALANGLSLEDTNYAKSSIISTPSNPTSRPLF